MKTCRKKSKKTDFTQKNTETSLTIQTCCAIMKRDFLKRNEYRLYFAINIREKRSKKVGG
ncbi:hypothetical protein DXA38_21240 [[Clostridium] innocuum]|uniref:Uncharacterized protein n=1 Tax=Clostridium innocuum TaxID=1522 RepID=A0A3E2VFU9_CLOIN|nr:hypothetical protein DXA38_21240 [[Clostridium] innocuum]